MHYRNGREAHNGDRIAQLEVGSARILAVGTLIDATPGNDYCNGKLVITGGQTTSYPVIGACLCDCLHLDDVSELLAVQGWNQRPAGK